MIQDKDQIITALHEKVDAFNNHISPLNKEQFEATPNEKWSAGQNLDHLIRSMKPLQLAYSLPKFILKWKFGVTNRPSRTYDQLVTKYKTKLAAGGRAVGPFIPPTISFDQKDQLLKIYEQQKQKLIAKIKKHNEKDLDLYILPHPLLGKLTLREMLFFTIHHNEHHLRLLRLQTFNDPNNFVSKYFDPEPVQWGLRGDPHLWRDMKLKTASINIPATGNELENLLYKLFKELTGETPQKGKNIYVKKYETIGVSKGMISSDFWLDKGFSLIIQRYIESDAS